MQSVELYKDRISNGIKVTFSGLSDVDLSELKKLDTYMYDLQQFASVGKQPTPGIYDNEVFELHMMTYSFLIKSPIRKEITSILKSFVEKLYEVVDESQQLRRLHVGESIPKHLGLDNVAKPKINVMSYSFDKLPSQLQETMTKIEFKERQLTKDGPRRVLKKYLKDNPGSTHYPVLDLDYWIMFKLTGLLNAKYHDTDLFSVMASIGQKIGDTLTENTKLKIKLESIQ